MKKKSIFIAVIILSTAAFLAFLARVPLAAADIYVTTTADGGAGSLRAAITEANGNGEADTIHVPAGTYTLTLEGAGEDLNATGDLDILSDMVIQGAGFGLTVIQAGTGVHSPYDTEKMSVDRVFHIAGNAVVTMRGLNIRYGGTREGAQYNGTETGHGEDGGGIYNDCGTGSLTLIYCYVNNNRAGKGGDTNHWLYSGNGGGGGGIYSNSGTLYIYDCSFSQNASGNSGLDDYYDWPAGTGGHGGAIYNKATTFIERTTFNGNSTGWGDSGGNGGAIYNAGQLRIQRATLHGNSAGFGQSAGGDGGAIYNNQNANMVVRHCTITGNDIGGCAQAYYDGFGGGLCNPEGTVTMTNTIMAENSQHTREEAPYPSGGNCDTCVGSIVSRGYNFLHHADLYTITGDATNDIYGRTPQLGSLAENGGFGLTRMPLEDSPVLDAGTSDGDSTDQRGYGRPVDMPLITDADDGSDIGAVEYGASSAVGNISLDRSHLYFAVTAGSLSGEQYFSFAADGTLPLQWYVNADAAWVRLSPRGGTGNGRVAVSVDASDLTAGTYSSEITIQDPRLENGPQLLTVSLTVYETGATAPPWGYVDSPVGGTTVRSGIPVSGWALDDVGVETVTVYRKPITGETGNVFIGNAVFVEGARPDVEAANPGIPNAQRAGWGYMLLTNFLPNGGNGTFTLVVTATDKEGNVVTLGEKQIICDNANATRPFGAIDTPTQGGAASGSDFVNFGWALTPQPGTIPTDGSTIKVWVDGEIVGKPVYNNYRKDIAGLFPGYANSNGAMGYFYLDTTAYANGVHNIAWSVTDDQGHTDGIGSRYFTIQNTGADQADTQKATAVTTAGLTAAQTRRLPLPVNEPVRFRKGFVGPEVDMETGYTDQRGDFRIQLRELEPLTTDCFGHDGQRPAGARYAAYLQVGGQLRPLPVGSRLNPADGVLTWQPGHGFIGNYRLLFLEGDGKGNWRKKTVVVEITPLYGHTDIKGRR